MQEYKKIYRYWNDLEQERRSHSWKLLFSRNIILCVGGYTRCILSHSMCECERDIKLLRDVTPQYKKKSFFLARYEEEKQKH